MGAAKEDASREAAIKWFFERERNLPAHHDVFVTRTTVFASQIIDVDGDAVFEGAPNEAEGFLIFVDEAPKANWAHHCRYIFSFKNGGRAIAMREWPPTAEIYDKLDKVERPR